MDYKNILGIPMEENDADASTIGEYLIRLLCALWTEGEGFSGKRPFGNSGWEYEIYRSLVASKIVEGQIDEEYGDLLDVNKKDANEIILETIKSLYY